MKNHQKSSGIEIIIFLPDLFESIYEYYNIFVELLNNSQNKKVLMLNLPGIYIYFYKFIIKGQAYTIFSSFSVYNSLIYSEMVDQIL